MPSGNLQLEVVTEGAIAVVAHPLLAGRSVDMRMEVEVEQRVDLRVDDEHDAATAAAVAAIGSHRAA